MDSNRNMKITTSKTKLPLFPFTTQSQFLNWYNINAPHEYICDISGIKATQTPFLFPRKNIIGIAVSIKKAAFVYTQDKSKNGFNILKTPY